VSYLFKQLKPGGEMQPELTLMSVGDVCIGTGKEYPSNVGWSVWKEGVGLSTWLEKVAPVLQQGDITVGNLEGPICEPLSPVEGKAGTGAAIIRMPPESADVLRSAGFDAMALANNHTMNFGSEGMLQTLSNLESAGIAPVGGGRNIHEARKAVILERQGVRLALLAYSSTFLPGSFPAAENKAGIATVAVNTSYGIPGNILYSPGVIPHIITTPRYEDVQKMTEDVQQARERADVVVVNWHWGMTRYSNSIGLRIPVEDSPFFVLSYQEEMGRAAIDAGADLVIGHHPHRLQGMEWYKGKLICYSLGTFTMPFGEGPNFGEETVIVKGYINRRSKELSKVALIPVWLPGDTLQPYILPIGEAGSIITSLEKLSKKYGTKFQKEGEEIVIH
jgi:poly-gamma-glutamate synthesis protein (capsule biosynthesis protein)